MSSPFPIFTFVPPDAFKGRATVIKTVCDQLDHPEFRSTELVGGPYTGKTSLLRYLASSEIQAKHPVLASSWNIYLSGDVVGSTTDPANFWASCFRELERQVDTGALKGEVTTMIDKTRQGKFDLFDLQDFLDKCAANNKRLVLIIDDFINLLRNRNFWPPSNFFHQVRSLGQSTPRVLSFVVGTPRSLTELWDTTANASPFYNIFLSVSVGRLTVDEVTEIVRDGFASLGLQSNKNIEQLVLDASGRQPSLVNFVASKCAEMTAGGEIRVEKLYEALQDPTVVNLVQRVRKELDLTEREWVDTARANPEKLSSTQINTLRKLWDLGLIQPGVRLP
jgi:hypothetical protein